jgi:hypothetical protein
MGREPETAKKRVDSSSYYGELKLAVTVFAASMVTVQPPVPEQPPLQPVKVDPAVGEAVSVTVVPLL